MSKRDAALLISRLIALYFIYYAVTILLALPYELLASHFVSLTSPGESGPISISERFKISHAAYYLVQLAIVCVLARVFYNFGPRVQRFLLSDPQVGS